MSFPRNMGKRSHPPTSSPTRAIIKLFRFYPFDQCKKAFSCCFSLYRVKPTGGLGCPGGGSLGSPGLGAQIRSGEWQQVKGGGDKDYEVTLDSVPAHVAFPILAATMRPGG